MKDIYKFIFSISVIIALIISCSTNQPRKMRAAEIVSSYFAVKIFDLDGQPIEGATVKFKFNSVHEPKRENVFTTSQNGFALDSMKIYDSDNNDLVEYSIEKEGFYKQFGYINISNYGQSSTNKPTASRNSGTVSNNDGEKQRLEEYSDSYDQSDVTNKKILNQLNYKKITLLKPNDYLTDDLLYHTAYGSIKESVLVFIDELMIESLLKDSYLMLKSIGIEKFKDKDNLTFSFDNKVEYNSLKLNKYDVGKLVFDELIRKILTPLNNHLNNLENFNGYDISVKTYYRSFLDKQKEASKLQFRFVIPKEVVGRYKNNDITGQGVLDESIILLDDERIELKLQ